MLSDAAGQAERAEAIRLQALAFAREVQRRQRAPDAAIDQLVAAEGRLTLPRQK
jgi:hypothetical protein